MLHLHLRQDEYFVINSNITIEVKAVSGKQVHLVVDAPREIPIVRGAVLERSGGKRPECLDAGKNKF